MRVLHTAVALLLTVGVVLPGGPALADPPGDVRGIYVYSMNVAVEKDPADAPQLTQALGVAGVDGLTLVEGWSALEPRRSDYEFTRMDAWIDRAVSSGKKINLSIRAGVDTPAWLFLPVREGGAGATPLQFNVSAHQGAGSCVPMTMAAPWDPAFLGRWDALLGAVAEHLRRKGTYGAVTQVRLTGINRTTDEFRLPEEILDTPDCAGNALATWLTASPPYRPERLLTAWDAITTSFQRSFPDKTFNVPIIPIDTGQGQYPFPEIDQQGCVYSPPVPAGAVTACSTSSPVPDQNLPLIALAGRKFPGRLVVEFENLDLGRPANPTVVGYAQTIGTMAAFMTNNYRALNDGAGAACAGGFINPVPCDASDYLALLETGIFPLGRNDCLRAQYIEVFPSDVVEVNPHDLRDDIWPASLDLHDVPALTVTVAADPPTLWPPGDRLVPVTVSGTARSHPPGAGPATAAFVVQDEYGAIHPSGPVTLETGGAYAFTVWLAAGDDGRDVGGRLYQITVSAQDGAGDTCAAGTTVLVPHDRRDG